MTEDLDSLKTLLAEFKYSHDLMVEDEIHTGHLDASAKKEVQSYLRKISTSKNVCSKKNQESLANHLFITGHPDRDLIAFYLASLSRKSCHTTRVAQVHCAFTPEEPIFHCVYFDSPALLIAIKPQALEAYNKSHSGHKYNHAKHLYNLILGVRTEIKELPKKPTELNLKIPNGTLLGTGMLVTGGINDILFCSCHTFVADPESVIPKEKLPLIKFNGDLLVFP